MKKQVLVEMPDKAPPVVIEPCAHCGDADDVTCEECRRLAQQDQMIGLDEVE